MPRHRPSYRLAPLYAPWVLRVTSAHMLAPYTQHDVPLDLFIPSPTTSETLMRPDTFLRYALALAFVMAGSSWLTTATAQQRTTTKEQANAVDQIGRVEAPGAMLSVPRALAPPTALTRGGVAVESFEEGFPPAGWEVVDVSGTGTWGTNASSARALNSPTSAFFNDFQGDQDDWLISAPFDLSGFRPRHSITSRTSTSPPSPPISLSRSRPITTAWATLPRRRGRRSTT